jgi:exopolysaccharide production protein ExoZ
LSYELFFYAVFAVFLRAGDAVRVIGATCVLALAYAVGHVLPPSAAREFLTQPLVFEFALGLFAGFAWRRGWRCPPRIAWAVFVAAAAWLVIGMSAAAFVGGDVVSPWARVLTAGVAGLGMTWALAGVGLRHRVGGVFVALGDASYSIYLLHPFVVGAAWFAWQRTGLGAPFAFIALCIVASAIAGWIAWRVIEAPMTRRLRRA